MFLVDSNIFLEGLLEQEKRDIASLFIKKIPIEYLHLTDFSLHSICLICMQKGRQNLLENFLADIIIPDDVSILTLSPTQLPAVLEISQTHGLDFDDAYQYLTAENHNLQIVSFDHDFDKTPRGRITPSQALEYRN